MNLIQTRNQYRRDFVGKFECGQCGCIIEASGYSDGNFYATVSVREVKALLKSGECIMVGADSKIVDLSHPFSKTPERTKE